MAIDESSSVNMGKLKGDNEYHTSSKHSASLGEKNPFERRRVLTTGTLASVFTSLAIGSSFLSPGTASAAPGDKNSATTFVPTAEKGAASGVATLDTSAKIPKLQMPDLSDQFALHEGADLNNMRWLSLNTPVFDQNFTYQKISGNQDGLIVVKDLRVTGGFGGQVGQGGEISYFKAIGIAAHHSGPGNYDHFWGSVYHDGPREAGVFIGDITGRNGGSVYGGHFRVRSEITAPSYLVGLALEIIPTAAKSRESSSLLAAAVAPRIATSSIQLSTQVQLTAGTNLALTASDGSTVVAYTSSSMEAASSTVPVTPFTTEAVISAGSSVRIGVNSTYVGLDVINNGSESASAAISVSHHGSAKVPFNFGVNLDSSAASDTGTGIMVGGVWGSGINMNANSIVQAGSIAGVGNAPNRDVRIADNLVLDNSRHLKFKDSSGTAQKAISTTSTNNLRFKLINQSAQFEFFDANETTLLTRVTSTGRGDFAAGGVTTRHSSGSSQPAFLANGQIEVWHDTTSGVDYLVVNVNGVSRKVALT